MQRHEKKKIDQQLWPSATIFLICRKEPKKTALNHWEKQNKTRQQKPHGCCPSATNSGVYEALFRRCRHGRKSKVFASRTIVCLFVVVVWVTCKHCPAAKWSGPRRCSCPCIAPQACGVAPRTHMWLDWGRLESPRFYPQSTPKETAVSRHTTCSPLDLGSWPLQPGSQLRPAGPTYFTRIVIKLSKSALYCHGVRLWHHGSTVTLARKTKYVLRNLRSGDWSPFKTYIIVLSTPQGVSLFAVSLQSKEPSDCGYTWALISCPRPANLPEHFPRWWNMTTYYVDITYIYIQPPG